jgi:hypothetical protein
MLTAIKKAFPVLSIATIAFVWMITDSQSQHRQGRNQTQTQTQTTQQKSPADQRGTEQSPLVIKQIPTETSETERAQKTKADEEKAELDRKLVNFNGDLAYYTWILAIVAIFQFIALFVQAIVFIFTLRATVRAANAAKDSADALPAIERAYVFVVPKLNQDILSSGGFGVHYYFVNHGKTPAIIDGIEVHYESLASPPNNIRFRANIPETSGIVIAGGGRWPAEDNEKRYPSVKIASIEDACATKVQDSDWFYGRITYSDVFGQARYTRFRWRFDRLTHDFSPNGSAPYNERT